MKRKRDSRNRSYADKEDGGGAAANKPRKEVVQDDGGGAVSNQPSKEVVQDDGGGAVSNQPSKEVVLGDLIWVGLHGSSWWPAQVFDDDAVSQRNKPRKKSTGKVLVRLYGSYKYMYVDPVKCRTEFENVLEQNNGNHIAIFKKALEQDLARVGSGGEKPKKRSKSKSQERVERRTKVMQRLGLVAPSGSPLLRNGHRNLNLSLCS